MHDAAFRYISYRASVSSSLRLQQQLPTSSPILPQSTSQDVKRRHSPAHIHYFFGNALLAGALVFRSSKLETDSSASQPTTPFKGSSKASASGGGRAASSPHTPSPNAASAKSSPHPKSGGQHSASGSKSKSRDSGGALRHHHKDRSPSPPKQCDSKIQNRNSDNSL